MRFFRGLRRFWLLARIFGSFNLANFLSPYEIASFLAMTAGMSSRGTKRSHQKNLIDFNFSNQKIIALISFFEENEPKVNLFPTNRWESL